MSTELIPGMAHRIRDTLKRRVHGDTDLVYRIEQLTNEQVYAQAPADAIQRVADAAPTDRSDLRQWERYRAVADEALDLRTINEWVRNLQNAHHVGPRKTRAA
jgi:hypothetical protein